VRRRKMAILIQTPITGGDYVAAFTAAHAEAVTKNGGNAVRLLGVTVLPGAIMFSQWVDA
jgi:hypothetical protein